MKKRWQKLALHPEEEELAICFHYAFFGTMRSDNEQKPQETIQNNCI
jgi:predicted metal-dependent HD superfamily phosphohydrolase